MDYLLFIYSAVLGVILISPFLFLSLGKKKSSDSNESNKNLIKRKMLLENLRDLKTDYETGKFSNSDFQNLSRDILLKLEEIDRSIPEKNKTPLNLCNSCGKKNLPEDSKFCLNCGNPLK